MTIRAGLRLVLTLLAGLFLAAGLWTIDHTHNLDLLTEEMSARLLPAVAASGAINTATSDLRIAELMHIGTAEATGKEMLEAQMTGLRAKIDDLRDGYAAATAGDAAAEAALRGFNQIYEQYLAISDGMLALSRQNRFDDAVALEMQSLGQFNAFSAELDRMVTHAENRARSNSARAGTIYEEGRTLIFAGLALVLGVCALTLWGLERRVAQPMATVAAAARALAQGRFGDTTTTLTARRDEIGDLARAVDQAAQAVRAAAAALGGAVKAAAAGDLAARTDPAAHQGDYAQLAEGVNRLIETLSRPLREVADVMRKVAAGDINGRMSGVYEGDLRALKANLNRSLDTVSGLLVEVSAMADGLAEGRLTVSINGAYQGAFADIRENVNDGLNSLRAALAVIYVNIGQAAAATVETAAAGNQVAALAADEAAARGAVRDVAALAERAHLAALNAGIAAARGGAGFAKAAADVAELTERAAVAADRLEGAGMRADGADSAAAAAQIGAAMDELARMVDEIRCEIQRFTLT